MNSKYCDDINTTIIKEAIILIQLADYRGAFIYLFIFCNCFILGMSNKHGINTYCLIIVIPITFVSIRGLA